MAKGNGNTGTIVTTVLKWQKIGCFSLFGYEVRTAGHKTAQIKKSVILIFVGRFVPFQGALCTQLMVIMSLLAITLKNARNMNACECICGVSYS